MKVFLIGSMTHFKDESSKKDNFKQACEELGESLIKKGCEIIVCSGNELVADTYIVKGVSKVSGNHKVIVFRPDHETIEEDPDEPVDPYSQTGKYSNIKFSKSRCHGGWRVVHLRAVNECDTIVAIGGDHRGTGTAVYSAEVLEKPVILIPSFGGEAQKAWRDFKRYYSEDECQVLEETRGFGNDWGKRITDVILSVTKRNPFKKIKPGEVVLNLTLGIVALALWFIFWFKGEYTYLPNWLLIYLMLGSSSLLGTVLRNIFRFLGIMRREPYSKNIFLKGFASLLIAFIIFMISQVANFLLNAEPIKIDNLADIQRIGLFLSILCFLAALFLEDYSDNLLRKWGQFIKKD